jgi:hypothetical protein
MKKLQAAEDKLSKQEGMEAEECDSEPDFENMENAVGQGNASESEDETTADKGTL